MGIGDSIQEEVFYNQFSWKLGDGVFTYFWNYKWLGASPFRSLFSDLFEALGSKQVVVEDCGRWVGEQWQWELRGFKLGIRR